MRLVSDINEVSKRREELNSSKIGIVKIIPGQKMRFIVAAYQNTATPFIFMQETHEVFSEKHGFHIQVPCLKDYFRYKKNSDGTVMVDGDGNPVLDRDPVTGKFLNDGTCPYCEVAKLEKQLVSQKIRNFFELNPDASKEQVSSMVKSLYSKIYVKDKLRLIVGILVAVIKTDATGEEPVFDDQGRIQFNLAVLKLTENQFEDKLKPTFEEAGQILNQEFTLNIPNKVDKQGNPDVKEAAKAMSFSPRFKNLFIEKDPTLLERIKEEAKKITLDIIESEIASFRKDTIPEAQAKLAGRKSVLSTELSSGEKNITTEEIVQPSSNPEDFLLLNFEEKNSAENFLDTLQELEDLR